jgi:hypothetical protein
MSLSPFSAFLRRGPSETDKLFPVLDSTIILNITSSFYPPTLAEHFYKYGYAMVRLFYLSAHFFLAHLLSSTTAVLPRNYSDEAHYLGRSQSSRSELRGSSSVRPFLLAFVLLMPPVTNDDFFRSSSWTALSLCTTCLFELMWRRKGERDERKKGSVRDEEGKQEQ